MRRIIAIALLALLIMNAIIVANAEVDLESVLSQYNEYAGLFGAPELDPDKAELRSSPLRPYIAEVVLDGITITFTSKDGSRIDGGICKCTDETQLGDYFAYCTTLGIYLFGVPQASALTSSILFDYLMQRGGNETTPSLGPDGGAYQMTYEDGAYLFVISAK